ncbi:hypothetical protein F4561_003042 [Lipingzhangella halophila]|uniref:Secreted protein n=1 Tax=Lipingzhangella halophila TaxID=1783352 RepID=A0A7W7RHR0_9ACTN|nr:hypothetical protein [Lipingzhangella halophila]MBB4932222.1 hypothetical protein [Lipingzhangella halophila]
MRSIRGAARSLPVVAGIALIAASGCSDAPAADDQQREQGDQQEELSSGEVLSQTAPDGHNLREVPEDEAPSVELEAEPDAHNGWNVHLITDGFEFTPQKSGDEARGGQGHAHLYVDGEKYGRMYGPWFHLPAEAVADGEHTLRVTLNADDHTTWAVDGEPVQAEQDVDGAEAPEPHDHDDGGADAG